MENISYTSLSVGENIERDLDLSERDLDLSLVCDLYFGILPVDVVVRTISVFGLEDVLVLLGDDF